MRTSILQAFTILLSLFGYINTSAQSLQSYPQSNVYFKQAVDLYYKEMYKSAQEKLVKARETTSHEALENAEIDFYYAMCALYTKQSNVGILLDNILTAVPTNPHYNEAAYGYGTYLYDIQDYKNSSNWFSKVEAGDLPQSHRAEYYFKSGYSNYRAGNAEQAINNFRAVKDQRNPYADAALYYYSHIEYENGNKATALKGFEQLRNNQNYSALVPYYTLQIAFSNKDYDKVIKEGKDFLQVSTDSRKGEITRLLCEAYLNKGDMEKASDYFAQYEKQTKELTREDNFLKGFIKYKNRDYGSAASTFKLAAGSVNDSLAQTAMYFAGDCYIKSDNKKAATDAFLQASKSKFDESIAENAYFNYAKLALELNNDSKPVSDYLAKYPSGKNNGELSIFLASTDAKNGKYDKALQTLNSISRPTPAERDAIQRVALASGIEMMKSGDHRNASSMFDVSIKNADYNNSNKALATYWKAEAAYQSGNFSSALIQFENFVNTAGSFKNMSEYKIAHYNIGYCYFKDRSYDNALRWFRKYISFEDDSKRKTKYLGDCYNRIGDCYFKKRQFDEAAKNYATAEALGLSEPDYSSMQRAISLGFTASDDAKLRSLQVFPRSYPKSKYLPAVYYETGRTYQQMLKHDEAISAYQKINGEYKASPYYPKALVELGLIELNKGNNEKALSYYQQVAENFQGTDEAKNALEGIKDIYVNQNRMDEYFAYSSRLGQTIKNVGEKEELIFTAAEKQYQSGDCDKALPAMKKYIADYPDGKSVTQANFYLADCLMRKGSFGEASTAYSFVTRQPSGDFTEAAWSGYARANYNMKKFAEAAKGFENLKRASTTPADRIDAEIGIMRSYLAMNNYDKAAEAAAVVAVSKGTDSELIAEANLIRGKAMFKSGKYTEAISFLKPLAKDLNKPVDAEAKYYIIASQYENKKYTDAENGVYEFSDSKSKQLYWTAKSFIILGDVYAAQKDYNQARATYKSIIDGYKDKEDGIADEAKKRYNEIENK